MSTTDVRPTGTVLVVEDDPGIGALVEEILKDEGFTVSLLGGGGSDTLRAAVARLEPDCIVLDGESPHDYGISWIDATWAANRDRAVPVIMLTGSIDAVREAADDLSARSQAARFAGVLTKPFDIDELIATVRRAVHGRG